MDEDASGKLYWLDPFHVHGLEQRPVLEDARMGREIFSYVRIG
jgi:hypothetical protein